MSYATKKSCPGGVGCYSAIINFASGAKRGKPSLINRNVTRQAG
jgi:hypothetical protein